MARPRSHKAELTVGLGLAAMHSAITIWNRLPMLAAACAEPTNLRNASEINRMVTEKASAAIEGAFNVHKELLRVTFAAMSGKLTVQTISDAALAMAAGGMRPGFRTVKANSRRLSRRG